MKLGRGSNSTCYSNL